MVMTFFKELFCNETKISFDKFCKSVSDRIDALILECEQTQETVFAGGSCRFEVTGIIKRCEAAAELYFCNSKNEWEKVSVNRVLPLSRFSEESVKTDIAELIKQHGIEAEITHPNNIEPEECDEYR